VRRGPNTTTTTTTTITITITITSNSDSNRAMVDSRDSRDASLQSRSPDSLTPGTHSFCWSFWSRAPVR
jgi:hypothetical protein